MPAGADKTGSPGREQDAIFMRRSIELAKRFPNPSPNPPVGAIVVRDGIIVGEGHHAGAGTDHAEVVALREAGDSARGAALYVTLEPCNHVGRTPPCTRAILDAGIIRVVYGTKDPKRHSEEAGHETLAGAGLNVEGGVLEREVRHLVRFFHHHSSYRRPWVIAKLACSLDGRIATRTGESKWITGEVARQRAHALRGTVDAILVGVNTVIADDPRLTVRLPESADGTRNPLRIVVDSTGRAPARASVFSKKQKPGAVLFATAIEPARRRLFEGAGVTIHEVPPDDAGRVSIPAVLDELGEMGAQSLLVEGGPTLLGAFHDLDLIDEVWTFVSPRIIGGIGAPGAVAGLGRAGLSDAPPLSDLEVVTIGEDILIRGTVPRNEAPSRAAQRVVQEPVLTGVRE
jgi:diaminohydroxyphosphoribosylaminopyrimidine deaminase/5-amino-6-(5-phosphoribosylamino)uracil reductase